MRELQGVNQLIKKMLGRKMTKTELQLQDQLREQVKNNVLTVKKAKEIWDRNLKNNEHCPKCNSNMVVEVTDPETNKLYFECRNPTCWHNWWKK